MAGKRVLIIDDSRSARAFLARMLERHGLEVDGVRSAEEGFAYMRRQLPDALFLDHLMPGMDGFQALEIIKKDPRTAAVPVMMYTSQQGDDYLQQAGRLGALGVLPKQLSAADVIGAIRLLGLQAPDAGPAQITTVIEPQRAPVRTAGAVPAPAPRPAPAALPRAAAVGITPELRALLQSMLAEQGRVAPDPLVHKQLQDLAQQVTQQGERLFAELRTLRRELEQLAPGTEKFSPLVTTIVDNAGLQLAASQPAAGPAQAGRPPVPLEVVAAIAEARRSLARAAEESEPVQGHSGALKLLLFVLVLAALTAVAWLLRPVLWPNARLPAPIAQLGADAPRIDPARVEPAGAARVAGQP
jgi:CheY-like chemotaxis protein